MIPRVCRLYFILSVDLMSDYCINLTTRWWTRTSHVFIFSGALQLMNNNNNAIESNSIVSMCWLALKEMSFKCLSK